MTHKMNKISGYYEGPDGIFYDFKHDEIFELQHTGASNFDLKKNEVTGLYYSMKKSQSQYESRQCLISGMTKVIRLGDL